MKKWILIITVLIVGVPGMLGADDTEIYGTVTSVSLEANVLIVFDSSESMDTADVPGEPYDPVTTYTIGFQLNHQLLEDTASNGGGEYYTATNYSELSEAFYQIMSSISEENAVFVAPVVPISRMNRTYAGDRIYLGFFKPQLGGRWIGNIKRYALHDDGSLYDANDATATTPDGLIKSNALSFWTTLGNDGPDVAAGGAAEVLNLMIEGGTARNIYTYTGTAPALSDSSNAFEDANTVITDGDLNVASAAERTDLFDTVHEATFGDIIHSEPVVVYYPDPDNDPGTNDEKP